MRELVPIRIAVKRELCCNKKLTNCHCDLNQIDAAIRQNMDWSYYVDVYGVGMHYSKDGFGEGDDPHTQFAATCVPEDFALAAVAKFPERITRMTPEEWEAFHDDDVMSDQPDEVYDLPLLQALAAKKTLGLELSVADRNALDPKHAARGIQQNLNRRWKDRCQKLRVTLK